MEWRVKRTDRSTELYRWLPLSKAVEELASKKSAQEFDSRLGIVVALCEGQTIETSEYLYRLEA